MVCENCNSREAEVYGFKDDQYFSKECWENFHNRMNLTQYEQVELSGLSKPADKDKLTMMDVLLMKEIWPAKYEGYSQKDKLITLKGKLLKFLSNY